MHIRIQGAHRAYVKFISYVVFNYFKNSIRYNKTYEVKISQVATTFPSSTIYQDLRLSDPTKMFEREQV